MKVNSLSINTFDKQQQATSNSPVLFCSFWQLIKLVVNPMRPCFIRGLRYGQPERAGRRIVQNWCSARVRLVSFESARVHTVLYTDEQIGTNGRVSVLCAKVLRQRSHYNIECSTFGYNFYNHISKVNRKFRKIGKTENKKKSEIFLSYFFAFLIFQFPHILIFRYFLINSIY